MFSRVWDVGLGSSHSHTPMGPVTNAGVSVSQAENNIPHEIVRDQVFYVLS